MTLRLGANIRLSGQSRQAAPMDCVPMPEPKTVKNRIRWDVTVPDVAPLVEAGAMVLREPDDEIRWYVLADPERNEFCAFTVRQGGGSWPGLHSRGEPRRLLGARLADQQARRRCSPSAWKW